MMMQKGDIVKWDYDGWTVAPRPEDCELFETTNETLAKDKGTHKEGAIYGPTPIILGSGRLIKGLEETLMKAEIGKEIELNIPPKDAYGDRDGKLMEVHSLNEIMRLPEFRKGEQDPVPGATVYLNNKTGTIISERGGRVRVDFNHQLAGKTLKYKFTLRSKVDKPDEKVATILEMHYGRPGDFKVEVKGDETTIVLLEQCKYDPRWLITKLQVVRDLREFAGMSKILLVEEYVKPAEAKEAEAKKDEKADTKEEHKDDKKEEKKADEKKKEEKKKEEHSPTHEHKDVHDHAHEHK